MITHSIGNCQVSTSTMLHKSNKCNGDALDLMAYHKFWLLFANNFAKRIMALYPSFYTNVPSAYFSFIFAYLFITDCVCHYCAQTLGRILVWIYIVYDIFSSMRSTKMTYIITRKLFYFDNLTLFTQCWLTYIYFILLIITLK